MMEGARHQHLHQEWQEPLEEQNIGVAASRYAGTGTTFPIEVDCHHKLENISFLAILNLTAERRAVFDAQNNN